MATNIFKKSFGDKRLDLRGNKLLTDLFKKNIHSIRQLADDSSGAKGWYRFLQNEKTDESIIKRDMIGLCDQIVKGKTVLAIQDSSEINLYNHKNRIQNDSSIGATNASEGGLGFLIHPSLVIDAYSCIPYGFSDVRIWNRPKESKTKHERKINTLPIEEKESFKWIESSENSKKTLAQAERVIIIQDREGDIYTQFATVPTSKVELLVRSSTDRTLVDGVKLSKKLAACDVAGTYSINIEGDKRKKQEKRTATLEVRFTSVNLKRPSNINKNIPESISLYAIEAKEINTKSNKPTYWRILTTIPVTNLPEALTVIEWYSWRWIIEEVFRILKKEGFNIEASELGSGKAIRKLCLLMLNTIIRIFQMRICFALPEEEGLPSDFCFKKEELECLSVQKNVLEGKTQKLKNPYGQNSLKWATWIIARLGGWKGYTTERSPGITTLWIGLKRFYDIQEGWRLAKDVSTR